MTTDALYPLIMAGGSGTRLWPASRAARPKHLLPLVGDRSLLQETSARLRAVAPAEHQFVVTAAAYGDLIRHQLPDVPPHQIVEEPEGLGTAAAVGLGAALVKARDPDGIMVCCPADHVITPVDGFRRSIIDAARGAQAGYVAVIGVQPEEPSTGYGYIEPGLPVDGLDRCFHVTAFREKPEAENAVRLVERGCLWNAGMFIWGVATLWDEYRTHLPALAGHMDHLAQAAAAGTLAAELPATWRRIEDRTTVDYGVLERSARVVCVKAAFSWSDVGSWDTLAAVLAGEDGNRFVGDVVARDTTDSLVFSQGGRLVAVAGLSGVVVVDTGDAVLVIPRAAAQSVRDIVKALNEDGRADLL